jgi:hypothetical protein
MEIWRARERYYIGIPVERLLIFLLFMALCVGLGLLVGGCYATLADLYGCERDAMAQGYCHMPKDLAKHMEKRS